MSRYRFARFALLLLPVLLLSGCAIESRRVMVAVLVLVPFLLVMAVLWMLHRPGGKEEEQWEQPRLPDADEDDDKEDHFLM